MLHIAVQIREVVSSNLNSMVAAAGNPVKMLGLFQHQLQEYIIALQGDLSRANRQQERFTEEAAKLDRVAGDWTEKAKLAMDHKREDLARAALLTREQTSADAAAARQSAQTAAEEAEQVAQAIADLEAKLAETNARLIEERLGSSPAAAVVSPSTRSERVMDRIATLEKRVDFAVQPKQDPAPVSVDAQIEQLRREAKVSEELAAMKVAAKPAASRKVKTGK